MEQEEKILNYSKIVERKNTEVGKGEDGGEELSGKESEENFFELEINRELETFNKIIQTLRELTIFIKQPVEQSREDEFQSAAEIKQKLDEAIKEVSELLATQKIYVKEADEALKDIKKAELGQSGVIEQKSEKFARRLRF